MKLFAGAAAATFVCLAVILAMVSSRTAGLKPFVYQTASAVEKANWLRRQAPIYRRDMVGSLPNGWGWSPRLEVAQVDVDHQVRSIHFRIEAKELARLVENAKTIEHRWLKSACKKFIHSSLYKNDVKVIDSFYLIDGSRVFQAVISPARCDAIYPPLAGAGEVL